MNEDLVLVTGGTGFVATHCIAQLLQAGYRVRTTVRSLTREPDVRAMLSVAGVDAGNRLTFTQADLSADQGWPEAVAGCKYVLHVASPFPAKAPKTDDELIIPARDGALRILRAARAAGVSRVVLTSSLVAIAYGHPPQTAPFDETSWTNLADKNLTAYAKSKTIAEKAAWDFIAREGGSLELTVVNPVGIFGPALGPDFAASILLVQRFMDGTVPGCPRISFGGVDVRDVADLHLRAMTNPAANGQRFLAVAGNAISIRELGGILRAHFGAAAKRVPTRELPDWLVRFAALFIPDMRLLVPELGKVRNSTSAKAQRLLGWTPRSTEEGIITTAESLIRLGLLKK